MIHSIFIVAQTKCSLVEGVLEEDQVRLSEAEVLGSLDRNLIIWSHEYFLDAVKACALGLLVDLAEHVHYYKYLRVLNEILICILYRLPG